MNNGKRHLNRRANVSRRHHGRRRGWPPRGLRYVTHQFVRTTPGCYRASMLAPVPTSFVYEPPTDPWLTVLHSDSRMLVLDKPSGLLTVPGKDPALADCLEARAPPALAHRHPGAPPRQGYVGHRADGARQEGAGRSGPAVREAADEKDLYRAGRGTLAGDDGLVDLPLATDWLNKPRQQVDPRSRPTEPDRLARAGARAAGDPRPPDTAHGRTHQLRASTCWHSATPFSAISSTRQARRWRRPTGCSCMRRS